MFGVFAASMFVLWAGDNPRVAFASLSTVPSATETFSIVAALMLASFTLGGVLFARRKVGALVLAASFVIAVVGIAWNIIAFLFWLAPIPFVWMAYRGRHDA